MRYGKRSFVCDSDGCECEAARRHQSRKEDQNRPKATMVLGVATGAPVGRPKEGYGLVAKERSIDNSYNEDRIDSLLRCSDGDCGCDIPHDLRCSRACGGGLHSKCLGIGAVATIGTLVCSECRLDDMQATQPATKEVRRIAAEQMVLELTSKKESTANSEL